MLDARRFVESLLAVAGIWLLFRRLPDYAASLYVTFTDSVSDARSRSSSPCRPYTSQRAWSPAWR